MSCSKRGFFHISTGDTKISTEANFDTYQVSHSYQRHQTRRRYICFRSCRNAFGMSFLHSLV